MLPEQASAGTPVTIRLQTQGSQPFLLAIGDAPGPTLIPGVPPLLAGGALLTLFPFTDAAGLYTSGFSAPPAVPLQGVLWYSHALTLGSNGAILGSNGCLNLFTL